MKKLSDKNEKRQDAQREKQRDDTVITVIRGLDFFIAQANSSNLGTMARILHTAKEDLIFWAVREDFHETAEDRFINQLLYRNDLFAAADFICRLASVKNRKKLEDALMKERDGQMQALMEDVRKTA